MNNDSMNKDAMKEDRNTTIQKPTRARPTAASAPAAVGKTTRPRTGAQPKKPAPAAPQLLCGECHAGESRKAVQACNDYLRMGAGRSLLRLVKKYHDSCTQPAELRNGIERPTGTSEKPTETHQNPPDKGTLAAFGGSAGGGTSIGGMGTGGAVEPPTLSLDTLKGWSAMHDWQTRADAYDKHDEDEKNQRLQEALGHGFALDYVRIEVLNQVAQSLTMQIMERDDEGNLHNLWLNKPTEFGAVETYNSAIISDWRGLLDDISKEIGARRKNSHLERVLAQAEKRLDYRKFRPEQLDRINKGEPWVLVAASTYFED